MKAIIVRIYTVWVWIAGGLYFFMVMLFGIIGMNLFSARKVYPPFKFLLRNLFRFIFVPVEVEYPKNFDKKKARVFMANHVSIVDVPLMGAFLPNFHNALEADSHFRWPIYKYLIKAYGQIPINRSNARSSLKSMQIAEERIKNNVSVIVFPEGHRTRTGELQNFKKLPFLMAQKAGADIVPMGISGMWHFSPGDSQLFYPSRLKIKFGEPISTQNIDTDALMQETRKIIIGLIEKK